MHQSWDVVIFRLKGLFGQGVGEVGESGQRENLRCCVLNEGNVTLFTNIALSTFLLLVE